MFWQFLFLFFTRYVSLAVLHDFYGYKRGIFTKNTVFREKFKFIRLQTTLYQCIQFSRRYHCECFTFHRADFHNVNWESSPIYQLPVVTRIRANQSYRTPHWYKEIEKNNEKPAVSLTRVRVKTLVSNTLPPTFKRTRPSSFILNVANLKTNI